MKRKLLAMLLSVMLLCAMLPLSAPSVNAMDYGDVAYSLGMDADGNDTVTVYGVSMNYQYGSIYVPDTIEGYPVTRISAGAFMDRQMTYLSLPDTIVEIGASVAYNTNFYNNKSNWSSDGVLYAGRHVISAQYQTYDNGVCTLREGTLVIADHAFFNSGALKTVKIPASVVTIGDDAFDHCSRLTDVYYGGSKADREKINIGQWNDSLLNATWHYASERYDAYVEHSVMDTQNGNGLAFRFKLEAAGLAIKEGCITQADYSGAVVNYMGNDCKLVGAGAVLTNDATAADHLILDEVNGITVLDVPAVYVQETEENFCAFATRVVNIPDTQLERTIYARPYYVVEVNGKEITVYGDVDSASCAEYL